MLSKLQWECYFCLKHLMKHMNLLPLDSHGVDFSRVRMWSLHNWAKYYRQTLLFGGLQDAQINSVFNQYCVNFQGQVGCFLVSFIWISWNTAYSLKKSTELAPRLMLSLATGRWRSGMPPWQAPSVTSWFSFHMCSRRWKWKAWPQRLIQGKPLLLSLG